MDLENLDNIVNLVSKGDTTAAEALFDKPGGRKHLESIVLLIVSTLPETVDEKELIFYSFLKAMNKIERRIRRQKDGVKILEQVYC